MVFENEEVYKVLKKILMYVFPAVIYVVGQLVDIWEIPFGVQINGTIFALYVGFAIFLGVSKHKYNVAMQGWAADGIDAEEVTDDE